MDVPLTADLNETAPIRAGEELPLERLEAWLKEHLPEAAGPLFVEQFPAGHSNLTYLLRCGTNELVLRRPPFGNQVKSAHDMGREFRVLSQLSKVFPAAPRPYACCDDESVIGAPFYVMERRRGLILRTNAPSQMALDPDMARRLSTALIDQLARLHSIDYQAAGLADLGKPEGYIARQVSGWAKRYEQARTGDVPEMDRVSRWLGEHLPPESRAAVIHNDYKYDNVVLSPEDPARIVAVLDWEMATLGDPLMDLGTTLGYWIEAGDPEALKQTAFGPTAVPGSLTRRELVARYEERTGRAVPNALFFYCFGLFKIAVIVQQIYARYVRGHTRDPRFARLGDLVGVLARQAEEAIQSGSL
ncbi:MAG: phosphotransferase family protein [Deltaproteobacteria bacterium]